MNHTFQIGTFALPLYALLVTLAAAVAVGVGKRVGGALSADVEKVLWQALLVGLLAARLAFVWQYRMAYLATPSDIVDIRDGGWTPWVGVVAAWWFAAHRYSQRTALKKPLLWGLLTGTSLWLVGAVILALQPGPPQVLAPLTVTTLDGRVLKLNSFRGQATVVNLWATWCPPCRREMPVLQRAQIDYPAVNFVFLNQGESAQEVSAWLAAHQLPLRNVLLDPARKAGAAFHQKALPTTLFFNAQGELVSSRVGELSAATLAQKLAAVEG